MRLNNLFVLLAFAWTLTGCATYGSNVSDALSKLENEQYEEAEVAFKEVLSPTGNDALLYYLELGSVAQMKGDYIESNRLLEQAYGLADKMNSSGVQEKIRVAMSNPRKGDYRGNDFERALINYMKALNYILLAQQDQNNVTDLEAARIEIRRLDILLSRLEVEIGTYQDAEDKENSRFGKMMKIFRTIKGSFNPDDLIFRTDAWSLYLSGVTYELNGEMDDARISYQDATTAFEKGYVEQYDLNPKVIQQARYDWIRTALKSGFERSELRQEIDKLDDSFIAKLDQQSSDMAEVILIQHLDLIPPKGELNFRVYIEPWSKLLVLDPFFLGGPKSQEDQFAWFLMVYADTGIADILGRYLSGGAFSLLEGMVTKKKIPLGPVWSQFSALGLDDAIGLEGLRVTVPYYPSHPERAGVSSLLINDESQPLMTVSSPTLIAMQELIRTSPKLLREAMARELLKASIGEVASDAVSEQDDTAGLLLDIVSKVAAVATSSAETRSWLTLPSEIRMTRLMVPAGTQELKVNTDWGGMIGTQPQLLTVNLEPGEQRIVRINSLSKSQMLLEDGMTK